METEPALMKKMLERVWRIVLSSTDRVLVANTTDEEAFVQRLCNRWLDLSTSRVLIIREQISVHGDVGPRTQILAFDDCRASLTSDQLRKVGLLILIEDDFQLMPKIDRVMDRMRASKMGMGDIPIVCVSHLPNSLAARTIAKWFNHLVDGKVMGATTVVKPSPAAEPVVTSSPSAPLHPYYRNFTAASSAARRLLRGQEKTRETYEAECLKDPKLPLNPAEVYRDFERKGGWAMFLTGQRSEADQ